MRTKSEPLHELTKLSCKVQFFYFLRDLGIKSADLAAKDTSSLYISTITNIMNNELCLND
jgi:hypothetical protein